MATCHSSRGKLMQPRVWWTPATPRTMQTVPGMVIPVGKAAADRRAHCLPPWRLLCRRALLGEGPRRGGSRPGGTPNPGLRFGGRARCWREGRGQPLRGWNLRGRGGTEERGRGQHAHQEPGVAGEGTAAAVGPRKSVASVPGPKARGDLGAKGHARLGSRLRGVEFVFLVTCFVPVGPRAPRAGPHTPQHQARLHHGPESG